MRVVKIEASNFMKLTAASVSLNDGMVEVVGDNRAGKTALLMIIQALKGKKFMPEMPLNDGGAKKGEFNVFLGGGEDSIEYVVTWTFNCRGKSYLKLEASDGSKINSPQDVLDAMCSKLMDPWAFVKLCSGTPLDKKKAADIFRGLMDFDYDCKKFLEDMGYLGQPHMMTLLSTHNGDPLAFLKGVEDALAENRKEWKRTVQKVSAQVDGLASLVPLDKRDSEPLSLSGLVEKQQAYSSAKASHDQHSMTANRLEEDYQSALGRLESAKADVEAHRAEAEKLPFLDTASYEAMTEQISSLEAHNEIARKAESLRALEADLESAEEKVEVRTGDIEKAREARRDALQRAKIPVRGMTIEDGEFYLDGKPFAQGSEEEKLSAGINVAVALFEGVPDDEASLKTLICENASLMGDKAKALLVQKCEQYGIQAVIEVVSNVKRPGIIFVEDGVAKNVEE